jgi:hypothetical protein
MTEIRSDYYVYVWLRANDSEIAPKYTPYYVGKGSGKRAFEKYGRTVPAPRDSNCVAFVEEGLTEERAFELESYCIKLYGRVNTGTGILRNRTDGGDGPSDMIMSEETRRKMSEQRRGEKHPLWGKPRPDHVKQKISAASSGPNSSRYGIPLSQETKNKISQSNTGKPKSLDHRKKLAAANCRYEYLIVSPSGEEFTINNLNKFCKDRALDTSTMNKAVKNGTAHKGWSGHIIKTL